MASGGNELVARLKGIEEEEEEEDEEEEVWVVVGLRLFSFLSSRSFLICCFLKGQSLDTGR